MQALTRALVCAAVLTAAVAGAPAQPAPPDLPNHPSGQPGAPEPTEAQPDPAAPAVPPAAPALNTLPAPDPRGDTAWALYHQAFAALVREKPQEARLLLAGLARDYPDHPAHAAASAVMPALDGELSRTVDTRPRADDDAPSSAARAELALFQTVHGIALGVEFCVLVECDEAVAAVALPLLGGGLALGWSLGVSAEWITPGHKAALNSGTLWGAYNAAMLLAINDADDSSTIMLTVMAGQLAGTFAGHMLWREARPSEGQIALGNTFALWSPVLANLALGAINPDAEADTHYMLSLAATDVGGLLGGYLASTMPSISRGRTLLIDAGGVVGGLAGSGIAVLIAGDSLDDQIGFSATLVGAAAGLGLAAYFSRDWDLHHGPAARLTLMPGSDGGLSAGLMVDLDL